MTRTVAPNDFGGRFTLNFDRTTPEFPCDRVTLPQMTRIFDPLTSVFTR